MHSRVVSFTENLELGQLITTGNGGPGQFCGRIAGSGSHLDEIFLTWVLICAEDSQLGFSLKRPISDLGSNLGEGFLTWVLIWAKNS